MAGTAMDTTGVEGALVGFSVAPAEFVFPVGAATTFES